jgi:hypothetical protein
MFSLFLLEMGHIRDGLILVSLMPSPYEHKLFSKFRKGIQLKSIAIAGRSAYPTP